MQVMKPDPKKFVKLSKLLARSDSSEEDPLWEGSSSESDRCCRTRHTREERQPRNLMSRFEIAAEAAHLQAPRIWQPFRVHMA
jgi:hypothetical protein